MLDSRPTWYIVNIEGAVVRSEDKKYLMMIRGQGEEYLPGVVSFPGGKVENTGFLDDVLEETLRREILEEVGILVHDEMLYVESHSFIGDGEPCVDIVFLCRHLDGEPVSLDPHEVESVHWMSFDEILQHPNTPEWTKRSIKLVEKKRISNNW
jgi:8-oxo-dGTP pyrophosphatase MutT (NUDIX family)